ncbi:MAG: hypothetical protein HY047_13645 [Acidobacteria bacterium]|nr:hypothetical protein [Acidobacteriota bacterium]
MTRGEFLRQAAEVPLDTRKAATKMCLNRGSHRLIKILEPAEQQREDAMRTKFRVGVAVGLLLAVVSVVPAISQAQAPPRSTSTTPSPSGRFQLLSENQGTVFMVDTATGRVWRYTLVTASASLVQARVDNLIAVQENTNGRPFTEAEKKALSDRLTREQTDEVNAENNPCKGLKTCFVEIDRLRLTPGGVYASEVVR